MEFKVYKNSSLSRVRIVYGKEVIKFNLFEQLKISEAVIERELKIQPSMYGFCLLLQKKLTTQYEHLRQQRKEIGARLFIRAKERLVSKATGRAYSDDAANAYVRCHTKYIEITRKCIEAKDAADTMYAVVRAFEQRKDLMQTISSNRRKEF